MGALLNSPSAIDAVLASVASERAPGVLVANAPEVVIQATPLYDDLLFAGLLAAAIIAFL